MVTHVYEVTGDCQKEPGARFTKYLKNNPKFIVSFS